MPRSLSRASALMHAPPDENDNGASIVAHYPGPVKPTPVTPSPAATLVLIRDRPGGGIECLLMQRHQKSKFAAGAFVFPGGKIEAAHHPEAAAHSVRGRH